MPFQLLLAVFGVRVTQVLLTRKGIWQAISEANDAIEEKISIATNRAQPPFCLQLSK